MEPNVNFKIPKKNPETPTSCTLPIAEKDSKLTQLLITCGANKSINEIGVSKVD